MALDNQSFWQREKNRILAACILAAVMLLFCALIVRQRTENEKLKENLGRIIDENKELKARVIEKCTDSGPSLPVKAR